VNITETKERNINQNLSKALLNLQSCKLLLAKKSKYKFTITNDSFTIKLVVKKLLMAEGSKHQHI
jgi:hypothetical protein